MNFYIYTLELPSWINLYASFSCYTRIYISGPWILVRVGGGIKGKRLGSANAGGPGAKSPDGSEVSFLKRFKLLENESIFQK